MRNCATFLLMGGLFLCAGCSSESGTRSPNVVTGGVPSDGSLAVDPRLQPLFDEFKSECVKRQNAFCLENLAKLKKVAVGAYPVETFSGEGAFPGGVSDSWKSVDESLFVQATDVVVRLEPFVGLNLDCYGKILLFHALGHALLGWKHPASLDDKIQFSNTSIMGYELYPICQKIGNNMATLVDDLFEGRLRENLAEDVYNRAEGESVTAYETRMADIISNTPLMIPLYR